MASTTPQHTTRVPSWSALPTLESARRSAIDSERGESLQVRRPQSLQRFRSATASLEPVTTVVEADAPEEEQPPKASQTEATPEERFERMMERFQLRRVSYSAGMPLTGSGSRIPSRRNSLDHSAMATATRRDSHRWDGTVGGAAEPPMGTDPPHPRREVMLVAKFRQKQADAVETIVLWIQEMVSTTFEPASIATQLRLSLLVAIFTIKLLYMPFAIAYEGHEDWVSTLDVIVDLVYGLNIVATCNTETINSKRQVVTSRRAIWRHYRRNGFVRDLVAAFPFEHALVLLPHPQNAHWFVGVSKLALQYSSVRDHFFTFHAAWSKEVMASDKSAVAWMLFSRYSHLIRIIRIIFFIVIVAHYFACMWSWLHVDVDPDFFISDDVATIHMNSVYVALQFLQGQGIETKTPAQAVYGSVTVLLGSIALAVLFGDVAILVANFSASSTAYQRRMERVFAVMGKLELPHPIRERVHQYYEYLHAEYELLDGEIVKFAKDLSHTLTLETVLFRFMDVLVTVPHWYGCSPDFQKQLVLSLSVRIYLPDDFIMRRGEVGSECYLINRGTCKLCEYPAGNYEPPTPPMLIERLLNATRRQRRTSAARVSLQVQGHEGAQTEIECGENGPYSCIRELTRGQSIGDFALLANYERSSDLRAVAYVEMCVIEREPFQRILTRYPEDRKVVVASIVRHNMLNRETQKVPCPLMAEVQHIKPNATVEEAIKYISRAMNSTESDRSIVFGVSEKLLGRMRRTVEELKAETTTSDRSVSDRSVGTPPTEPVKPAEPTRPPQCARTSGTVASASMPPPKPSRGPHDAEIMAVIQEIQERMMRLDRSYRNMIRRDSHSSPDRPSSQRSNSPTVDITLQQKRRQHTAKAIRVQSQPALKKSGMAGALPITQRHGEESGVAGSPPSLNRHSADGFSRPPALQPTEPFDRKSPSLYADQLYGAARSPT